MHIHTQGKKKLLKKKEEKKKKIMFFISLVILKTCIQLLTKLKVNKNYIILETSNALADSSAVLPFISILVGVFSIDSKISFVCIYSIQSL